MSKTLFKGTKGQWNYKVTSWTRIPSITISQEHTDPFTRKQFQIVEVLKNLFVVMKLW
jgi:hypothetical protein